MGPLQEVANRQGVWSVTADNLKRNLDRARRTIFILSVLGALLAAIASQVPSDRPRFYLAISGALLLAVVSFLTGRLMGSEHIIGLGAGSRRVRKPQARSLQVRGVGRPLR